MNYLSPERRKTWKKSGIFFAFCSKTNLPKLELFQNLCFRIALLAFCSSSIIVRDLHPPFSYRTQKLSVQFLLKANVHCRSLVHLSVTILSTLVLCIHSLYPLAAAAAHIYHTHQPNVCNYRPPSSVVPALRHWFSQLLGNFSFPPPY